MYSSKGPMTSRGARAALAPNLQHGATRMNTKPSAWSVRGVRSQLRIVLQLLVSVALLALLLSRLDWSRALLLIRDANPGWLALLLALHSADRVLMAL